MGNTIFPQQLITKRGFVVVWALVVALLSACANLQQPAEPRQIVGGGDAQRGALVIQTYGCGSCHRIPGIAGADALVGPPLDGWSERHYIAGTLPNQPQYLIAWIRSPQEIEPGSAMPNMGVSEQEARDISAYLYSLADEQYQWQTLLRRGRAPAP